LYGHLAQILRGQALGDGFPRLGRGHPIEGPGITQHPVFLEGGGELRRGGRRCAPFRFDDHLDGQPVLGGEFEITLVVSRDGHDRAGAVFHEDEVRHVDRHLGPGHRIDTIAAGKNPFLFEQFGLPVAPLRLFRFLDKTQHCRFLGCAAAELCRHGVFGGETHEGCPAESIGPRCENRDLTVARGQGKHQTAAEALADPVPLHGQDPFRPARELVGVVEQFLHIGSDTEEPLVHLLLHDRLVAAPAGAAFNLLVGQHRMTGVTPVDVGAAPVCQIAFIHFQKE